MSELIDREAALDAIKFAELGREYDEVEKVQIFNPWHRVEDGLPEMSEIVPGYVCSETLVLYDAKSGHIDIGYVREKPDGVDWLCGEPFKNPTHWMPIEPPKEDA